MVQDASKLRIQIHSTKPQVSPSPPLCSMPNPNFCTHGQLPFCPPGVPLFTMSCFIPAFFTHHFPFYALSTILWSKSHGLSCHHLSPSLPLTLLISSITVPVAPFSRCPCPHSHHSPMPVSFWHIWLLLVLTAAQWVQVCFCFHTTLSSQETHKSARGSASGKFPALIAVGKLKMWAEYIL